MAGIPIRVRFDWYALDTATARWVQAFSLDEGRTWTTNWIMNFTRATDTGHDPTSPVRTR